MRITLSFLIICLGFWSSICGQQSISIFNGSFEKDIHGAGKTPYGWYPYPDAKTSSPDIHSRYYTYFNVSQEPSEGDRFISLATRADGSAEGICQYLEEPILSEVKYQLTLDLSLSEKFESHTKDSEVIQSFNNPCRLEVWGFNRSRVKDTLLAISTTVDHTEWKSYKFFLQPEMQVNDLCLFVSYPPVNSKYTNGNILMDNIQPLLQMYNHPALPADPEILTNKSDEDLSEILKRVKQELLSSGATSPELKIFLSVSDVEKKLLNQTVQNYIYNTDRSVIFQHIKILEAIQANNLSAVIKRAFSAYLNPQTATQEDVDFFNSSEAIFQKANSEKSLLTSKLNYLKVFRKQFVDEVKSILY